MNLKITNCAKYGNKGNSKTLFDQNIWQPL